MNVIAFDPGKATGVAWYDNGEFGSYQLDDGFAGVATWLTPRNRPFGHDRPPLEPLDAVVCESFSVRQGTHKMDQGAFMDVWSNIGAIRYAAFLVGVPFHLQSPAEAKSFGTNDKLHALGWYKGAPGHADDASRHLLTFLAKQRDPEILERLTAP